MHKTNTNMTNSYSKHHQHCDCDVQQQHILNPMQSNNELISQLIKFN